MKIMMVFTIIIMSNLIQAQDNYILLSKIVYNSANKIEEKTIYNYTNGLNDTVKYYDKEILSSYTINEFDNEGLKIKSSFYYSDGRLSSYSVYEYDKHSRLKTQYQFDKHDKQSYKNVYTYNNNNKWTKISHYNNDNTVASDFTSFKYSNSGKIKEQKSYSNPLTFNSKLTYQYNESDVLIGMKQEAGKNLVGGKSTTNYESKNGLVVKTLTCGSNICDGFIYEYDKAGNCIKESAYYLKLSEYNYNDDKPPPEIIHKITLFEYKKVERNN